MRKENADMGPSEADGLEDKGTYGVLTWTIPLSEDQLSPIRTGCPPPPCTILQRSFKVEVLLDHGEMELEYDHIYNYATFSCHYPTSSSKNQCCII